MVKLYLYSRLRQTYDYHTSFLIITVALKKNKENFKDDYLFVHESVIIEIFFFFLEI